MMAAVEEAVVSGTIDGKALPTRAALWPITAMGALRDDPSLPLPPAGMWMLTETARTTDFRDKGGEIFRFCESDAVPGPEERAWLSARSGAGLPRSETRRRKLSWWLGIGAAAVFFLFIAMLAWSGRTVSDAHAMIAGTATDSPAFVAMLSTGKTLAGKDPPVGMQEGLAALKAQFPMQTSSGMAATEIPKCATADAGPDTPFCQALWGLAVKHFQDESGPLGAVLGWPLSTTPATGQVSFAREMAVMMGAIVALGIALGLGTQGSVFGVWISPQNRISLARAQVTAWTVVVLGGYAAITIFNIGATAGMAKTVFPEIPAYVLGTLGISFATAMISPILKGDASLDAFSTRFRDPTGGDLEQRALPSQASLADLFMGELNSDKNLVDISRLQNVILTAVLVSGYAVALFGAVQGLTGEAIATAFRDQTPFFTTLPDPGGYFVTLLLGSQVAYIAPKMAG